MTRNVAYYMSDAEYLASNKQDDKHIVLAPLRILDRFEKRAICLNKSTAYVKTRIVCGTLRLASRFLSFLVARNHSVSKLMNTAKHPRTNCGALHL